jgi:hypothetical protein
MHAFQNVGFNLVALALDCPILALDCVDRARTAHDAE